MVLFTHCLQIECQCTYIVCTVCTHNCLHIVYINVKVDVNVLCIHTCLHIVYIVCIHVCTILQMFTYCLHTADFK